MTELKKVFKTLQLNNTYLFYYYVFCKKVCKQVKKYVKRVPSTGFGLESKLVKNSILAIALFFNRLLCVRYCSKEHFLISWYFTQNKASVLKLKQC